MEALPHSSRCRCGRCDQPEQPALLANHYNTPAGEFVAASLELRNKEWFVNYNILPYDPEHRVQHGRTNIVAWNFRVFMEDEQCVPS